jgi:hypothetical protein
MVPNLLLGELPRGAECPGAAWFHLPFQVALPDLTHRRRGDSRSPPARHTPRRRGDAIDRETNVVPEEQEEAKATVRTRAAQGEFSRAGQADRRRREASSPRFSVWSASLRAGSRHASPPWSQRLASGSCRIWRPLPAFRPAPRRSTHLGPEFRSPPSVSSTGASFFSLVTRVSAALVNRDVLPDRQCIT